MKRETIATSELKTICWTEVQLVDWSCAGNVYLNNKVRRLGKYHYGNFDGSVISLDGRYAFIYKKLGTKGLLLKDGELLREINRPYYCAEVHEYPAVFLTIEGKTYLVHCPLNYGRLDFENVETGEIITDVPGGSPSDVFHSRLEIDPENKFLLCKGWVWHPLDFIEVFNIKNCIDDPLLLDKWDWDLSREIGVEICTASFINGSKVLIGTSDEIMDDDLPNPPEKHIAVWDLNSNQIMNRVKVNGEFGNLFAINDEFAWDTFICPKIINIKTGEIVDEKREIFSGKQNSSIIHNTSKLPLIAFNSKTKQLAIGYDNKIEILTPF